MAPEKMTGNPEIPAVYKFTPNTFWGFLTLSLFKNESFLPSKPSQTPVVIGSIQE